VALLTLVAENMGRFTDMEQVKWICIAVGIAVMSAIISVEVEE